METAPAVDAETTVENVTYQKSLGYTGDIGNNRVDFERMLDKLPSLSGISLEVDTQDYWRASEWFPVVLQDVIERRSSLGPHLSPETNKLGIRAACPVLGCGLADKHGIKYQYNINGIITCVCPSHGPHSVNSASREDFLKNGIILMSQ